jgi:hypothetical protein
MPRQRPVAADGPDPNAAPIWHNLSVIPDAESFDELDDIRKHERTLDSKEFGWQRGERLGRDLILKRAG